MKVESHRCSQEDLRWPKVSSKEVSTKGWKWSKQPKWRILLWIFPSRIYHDQEYPRPEIITKCISISTILNIAEFYLLGKNMFTVLLLKTSYWFKTKDCESEADSHPLLPCMFYMALCKIICQVSAKWLCNETKSSLEEITVSWHLIDVAFIFLFIFIFYSWFIAPAVWTSRERSHWEIHLWSFTMCKCLSVEIIPLCWTDLTGNLLSFTKCISNDAY